MLSNYLKIAFRALWKFKGFASINLLGLSLGLTAGMLIMIYVLDEMSYDNFHSKADRIYRVSTSFLNTESGKEGGYDANDWPVGNVLRKDFPEVEKVLYARSASNLLINQDDKRIRQKLFYVSREFLDLFSFDLKKGSRDRALNDPYSIVITEDMEKKFFPGQDALNKTLTLADTMSFVVTGVMANVPGNSSIQFDMLVSFSTYEKIESDFSYDEGWGNINMLNYVLLNEGADAPAFIAKARMIYMDRASQMLKDWGTTAYVNFEPLRDLYLRPKFGNSMGPVGSIERVYLVLGIAGFVILLACINFINLATARSVYRAREVGLRKVVGSSRGGLIRQFLSESLVVTVLSFIIALVLTTLLLPYFNLVLVKNYELKSFFSLNTIAGIGVLIIVIAFMAGYYPAWIISSLKPVDVLKGKMHTGSRGVKLRRTLVVFQFVVSVCLVIGSFIVLNQLDYMQKQNLGFAKDQIVVVNAARSKSPNPNVFETFKNELKSLAPVSDVTFTNSIPGVRGWQGQIAYPEGRSGDDAVSVEYMAVDADYVATLGLEVIAGRSFDIKREAELSDGLVLNESAVSMMGWNSPEEAIGKKITSPSGYPAGEVIGVVKDYHNAGLQQKIGGIAMDFNPRSSYLYAIRYKAADTKQLLDDLSVLWKKNFPGFDFNYFFLDQNFEIQYQAEQRLAQIFGFFAGVTILIASIGLLGLVSFMVVARTKEIGVRKILGADVANIVGLLSKEFLVLVLLANVIAMPIAWYFADEWLQKFAYRMSIEPMLFALTLFISMAITLVTVSYQTVKAALTDPVRSLRYE